MNHQITPATQVAMRTESTSGVKKPCKQTARSTIGRISNSKRSSYKNKIKSSNFNVL